MKVRASRQNSWQCLHILHKLFCLYHFYITVHQENHQKPTGTLGISDEFQ